MGPNRLSPFGAKLIRQIASPNWGARKHGLPPDMVVVHYTAMETAEVAIERLCDPVAEVSAHYVICKSGVVTQLVDEVHRAWHAGAGNWGGVTDINSHSIGIELDYCEGDFPEVQLLALETLLKDILLRHNIVPHQVIGHSDMAPTRKFDPGPEFPWARLARLNLSVWPDPKLDLPTASITELWEMFRNAATVFGYRAPVNPETEEQGDPHWNAPLRAFRERFSLPMADNITPLDVATIQDLARRYPAPQIDTDRTLA